MSTSDENAMFQRDIGQTLDDQSVRFGIWNLEIDADSGVLESCKKETISDNDASNVTSGCLELVRNILLKINSFLDDVWGLVSKLRPVLGPSGSTLE